MTSTSISIRSATPPNLFPNVFRWTVHEEIHIALLIIYQENKAQTTFAYELWTRIRHEFPELRIYRVFDKPLGPHPVAMFEVNVFTPAQFGAFIPWLVINRGPLSALVHPNTGEAEVSSIDAEFMQLDRWGC